MNMINIPNINNDRILFASNGTNTISIPNPMNGTTTTATIIPIHQLQNVSMPFNMNTINNSNNMNNILAQLSHNQPPQQTQQVITLQSIMPSNMNGNVISVLPMTPSQLQTPTFINSLSTANTIQLQQLQQQHQQISLQQVVQSNHDNTGYNINNNHNNMLKQSTSNINNNNNININKSLISPSNKTPKNSVKPKSVPINNNNPFSMVLNKTQNENGSNGSALNNDNNGNITSITSITNPFSNSITNNNTKQSIMESQTSSPSTLSSMTSTPIMSGNNNGNGVGVSSTFGGISIDQFVDLITSASSNNNIGSILTGLNSNVINNNNKPTISNPFSDSININTNINNINSTEKEMNINSLSGIKIVNNNNPFSCQSPGLSSNSSSTNHDHEHNKDDTITLSSHSNDTNASLNIMDEDLNEHNDNCCATNHDQHHHTKKRTIRNQSPSLQVNTGTTKDIKPYKCQYCSKLFAFKKELLAHQTIHSGSRPYECHICAKQFVSKSRMESHIKKTHHQ